MDGFDQSVNVKVIMATNRPDTLDPALMRPGRLDRKIEFPNPDRRQKRLIFSAVTSKMNLSDEVDLEDYVNRPERISAADIASIAAEAGLQAVRHNRYVVLPKDLNEAYRKVVKKQDTGASACACPVDRRGARRPCGMFVLQRNSAPFHNLTRPHAISAEHDFYY